MDLEPSALFGLCVSDGPFPDSQSMSTSELHFTITPITRHRDARIGLKKKDKQAYVQKKVN